MEQHIQEHSNNTTEISEHEAGDLIASVFSSVMTQQDFDESVIRDYCTVTGGEIYFDTSEQAEAAVTLMENWILQTNQDIFAAIDETEEPIPVLQLEDFQYHKQISAVTFQAFSETEAGIRKQLVIFLDYCKTLEGIKKFDAPILQTIKPIVWNR